MFLCINANCQSLKVFTFKLLEKELVLFLIKNKDIFESEIKDYNDGKKRLNIFGIYNNYRGGKLKNGIYCFSQTRTHVRNYFVIIENENFIILNISNRQGLDIAIKDTLDFCERNKYCEKITNDYITRLIRTYYNFNKNPIAHIDLNCENGIKDKIDLP